MKTTQVDYEATVGMNQIRTDVLKTFVVNTREQIKKLNEELDTIQEELVRRGE